MPRRTIPDPKPPYNERLDSTLFRSQFVGFVVASTRARDTLPPMDGEETLAETRLMGDLDTATAMGQSVAVRLTSQDLVDRYRALIDSGAIYYPVAYNFLRELGRGRQGVVFLGLRQGARSCITRHAIKLYDPGLYSTPERYYTDMGRIASQISKLQSVRSPSLVARETYEEANGIGYVQMEFIDGLDLGCLLQPSTLEKAKRRATPKQYRRFTDVIYRVRGAQICIQPGVVTHILRQILRGLETLHEQGFVHSDVKPANVMMDRLGNIRLIDYGRANKIREKVSILLGTPHYMAPETHRRLPSLIQTDLYSVGLLGIEMLVGRPVVSGRTERELLAAKLKLPDQLEKILPRHVLDSDLFTHMLRKLVHPDPAQRFENARDAEAGDQGLAALHRELVRMRVDADYERELEQFLARVIGPHAKQIEMADGTR